MAMNATIEIHQPPPISFSVGKTAQFDFGLVLELIVMPSIGIAVASFTLGPHHQKIETVASASLKKELSTLLKPILGKHVIEKSNIMLAVVEAVKEGQRRANDAQAKMCVKYGPDFEASETIEIGSFEV